MEAALPETTIGNEAEPFSQAAMDYARIERALRFLNTHYLRRPTLDEIAAHIHLSPFHFERLFQRWAGTSPKRFLQYLAKEHAKALLQDSRSLLDATYESGLSGTGRLHDLFVSCEAVTPGEYKLCGEGVTIEYGSTPSRPSALRGLRDDWPAAEFINDGHETVEICRRIFSRAIGQGGSPFHLHLRGTNFQLKVWQALVTIPSGRLAKYGDLAAKIGAPTASRAVGSAVGRNPIAYLIPCHRVIRSLGVIGGYRWGRERKQAIIGWETARVAS